MKKQFLLFPLLAVLLQLGCAKEEKGSALDTIGPSPSSAILYFDDVAVNAIDASGFVFDNSVVPFHESGCDNGASESLHGEDAGDLSESRSDESESLQICCSLNGLSYTDSPSPEINAMGNIGQAFESTTWYVGVSLFDNTTNTLVEEYLFEELIPPFPRCGPERMITHIFNDYVNGVGENCPNDFTFTLTRYYEWLDSEILVECCSKSIDISFPVSNDFPPC